MYESHEAEKSTRGKERWEEAWDNWWSTDRVDAIGWALIFLWGALVIVADNTSFRDDFDWWEAWGVFFAGFGIIVLVEAVARLFMTEYRSKWGWTLFWGTVWLAIGLGELASPIWYALPLVAIAAVIMASTFTRTN